MVRKCKFQMASNVLEERQYPHKSKHQQNTAKSQKLKKVVSTCRE